MTLFRGANKGIEKMIGASFYSEDYEIAESYAELEEDGVVYEFNPIINLFDADDFLCATDIDAGLEAMIEELENFDSIFENYDGIVVQDGVQVILFGTLDINDDFKKQTLVELLKDANAVTRRYDR
jgi:hypothetical protein